MKISEKDKKTLLIFLSILVIACTYFFLYTPMMRKVNEQSEQTKQLQSKLSELKNMEAKRVVTEKEIKEFNEQVKNVVKNFPEKITTESEIAYLLKFIDTTEIKMSSVSLAEKNEIYNNGIVANSYQIAFPFQTTYEGVKTAIQYLNNNKQRTSIETFNASYDATTGNLSGNMEINLYCVPELGTKYEQPDFGDMKIGTQNLFGTFEINYNSKKKTK